ncbi:MAG: aldehyde ferredoxin oxidoreductase family protein [Deltaproteobacteria bacterium]|nr:aldehyde ferredoxin oxidoreductase family protein [Deltaproteobacteria bacterium]
MFGYMGKILHVDLATGKSSVKTLNNKIMENTIGGRGLGAYLMWHEVGSDVDPLGPGNKCIIATGPFTGAGFPTSIRALALTKSPLTGIYLFSMAGSRIGLSLKKAGYDAMVIEGKAETPSYLTVNGSEVTIKAAPELWGLNTSDAFKKLADMVPEKSDLVAIGPAGENLVNFSALIGADHRRFGRGGFGAVLGSKNLKAIAISGRESVEVAQPEEYKIWLNKFRAIVKEKSGPRDGFGKYGTGDGPIGLNDLGILPMKNWQQGTFDRASNISMVDMRDKLGLVERDSGCFGCPIQCGSKTMVREGRYRGASTHGPEYETMYALGSSCAIDKPEFIIAANALCDDLGLDTMSAGVVVSFAMECFERGLLKAEDNDGRTVGFGDDEGAYALLKKIAAREGIGDILAEGTRSAANRIGGSSDAFAMHVKGMELGGYDPRGAVSQAITYAAGSRGGCHHGIGLGARVDALKATRHETEGKASLIQMLGRKQISLDSIPGCTLGLSRAFDYDIIGEGLSLLTGIPFDKERLECTADRILTLERIYNIREGMTRKDDTLPMRLLTETLPDGPSKGHHLTAEDLNVMLSDYYRLQGWDESTGVPSDERLRELGLTEMVTGIVK